MKHWTSKLLFLAAAILVVNVGAHADSLTLTGAPGPGDAGVITGPYQLTDNTTNTSFPVICDDFDTDVYVSYSWTGDVNTLGDLAALKFGVSDPGGLDPTNLLQEYQAAFYLATELFAVPNIPANATTIDDLSFAIWGIFSSNARSSSGYDANAANLDTAALGMTYGATQYFNDLLYTPNPLGSSQEYLALGPTPTPEPSSYVLLAIGMMGLLELTIVQKRRNRRRQFATVRS